MSNTCLLSNQWITLEQNDVGQLSVTPVPSPRPGNALQLADDGIYVPGYLAQSAKPTGPQDGDLWRYSFESGIEWNFVWRADLNKWVWHGGQDLWDFVEPVGTRSSTSYGNLTVGGGGGTGPTVHIPFAGTYMFQFGAQLTANDNTHPAYMALEIAGTPATDADSLSNGNQNTVPGMKMLVRTIAAECDVVCRYKQGNAGTATFGDRWMMVRPVELA